jgi:polysaccharide pyruvyl transferase WcaK-like protein/SAM-dependent methyltransferase/glycosyltransferase involved in cell wall biosynthesis
MAKTSVIEDRWEQKIREGEALFAQGKTRDAEAFFLTMLKDGVKSADLYNNLAVILFQHRDFAGAVEYFTLALEMDPCHRDAMINCSAALKHLDKLREALPLLEKAAKEYPEDSEVGALFQEARSQSVGKSKMAFLCLPGLTSFLEDIIDFFKVEYDVRTCFTTSRQEIDECVGWADWIWLEWANELAQYVTNSAPKIKGKRIVCRLHGYEVFTDFPNRINWSMVEHLLFVAPHKQALFNRRFHGRPAHQWVVQNGVNTSRFCVPPNKRNTKRLVLLGNINHRKGLLLLLQFYYELLRRDPSYHLYIRGEFQDLRLELAARKMIEELSLDEKLEFVPRIETLSRWFEDKSHILSFSMEESFHYAIAEGMASGMKPVIHAWPGSRDFWPGRFIFRNLEEFLGIMMEEKFQPQEYRRWIEEHASLAQQLQGIEDVLSQPTRTRQPTSFDIRRYYNAKYREKRERAMRSQNAYSIFLDQLQVQAGKLLDVGCGTGFLVKEAMKRGLLAYGTDISVEATQVSKQVAGQNTVVNAPGESLPFKGQTFDYLTCIGSLEHFLDMRKGLSEFARVLKSGGTACIVVPNENFIGWQDTPNKGTEQQEINEHLNTIDGWEGLLEENGFEVVRIDQDNAISPELEVPTDWCYQLVFICRKKAASRPAGRKPMRLLMTGGYGFGNLGDEAILGSILQMIRSDRELSCRIRVVSGNPRLTGVYHPGIEKAVEGSDEAFEEEVGKAHALLFGGGGIFYDFGNPRLENIRARCRMAQKALEKGKDLLVLGVGIDNLELEQNKIVLRDVLRRASLLSVRDSRSLQVLRQMGLSGSALLTADPAFALYDEHRRDGESGRTKTVGLSVRPVHTLLWGRSEDDERLAMAMAQFLDELLGKSDFSVEFVTCKKDYDEHFARQIISLTYRPERCRVIRTEHWSQIMERQRTYHAFFGMSLHSLIFSFMAHTPTVGISYSTKIDGLCETLGLSDFCIPIGPNLHERLAQCWGRIESGRGDFNFTGKNMDLKKRALENRRMLHDFLAGR